VSDLFGASFVTAPPAERKPRELVGAAVRVDRDYPLRLLSDKTLRLLIDASRCDKGYLLYVLRAPMARAHIEQFASGSSESMRNISQDVIKAIPMWLPPLAEQRRIAAFLKAQLAEIEQPPQQLHAQAFRTPEECSA
jgi:type I restriction enzyme S subunit